MGTSSAFGGPSSSLIPSWLPPYGGDVGDPGGEMLDGGAPDGTDEAHNAGQEVQIGQPPLPEVPLPSKFSRARGDFSRFAKSGGRDVASLGKGLSKYVASQGGGARQAAARMGASRQAGAKLYNFLSNVVERGAATALQALNLAALAGRPIVDVFIGLADYICPDGGAVDEGIARGAFIETIADLAVNGITDLNAMNESQVQTVFEIFATNAIEARIVNDIGMKSISLPDGLLDVDRVQTQLKEFIRGGVADALTRAREATGDLTQDRVLGFVDHVYHQAFAILQRLGEGGD